VTLAEGLKELNQGQLEGLTVEELRQGYPEFLRIWLQEPETTPSLRENPWENFSEEPGRRWSRSSGNIRKVR